MNCMQCIDNGDVRFFFVFFFDAVLTLIVLYISRYSRCLFHKF